MISALVLFFGGAFCYAVYSWKLNKDKQKTQETNTKGNEDSQEAPILEERRSPTDIDDGKTI
jgi:hypothetical protein